MRDRLIDIIAEELGSINCAKLWARDIADRLLAEGVIVPPYKPLPLVDEGDEMLCPICGKDLMGCYFDDESPTVVTCYGCGAWLDNTKAVTREEVEKALEERSENGT